MDVLFFLSISISTFLCGPCLCFVVRFCFHFAGVSTELLGASALAYTNMNKKPIDYAREASREKAADYLALKEKTEIANEKNKKLFSVFKSSVWYGKLIDHYSYFSLVID
jgi:hypothetical protein